MMRAVAPLRTPAPGPRWLPNAITILRMLAVPPLVWLLSAGEHRAALWLAFAAGASDGVDGFLAKRFGWQSRLGGLLDPLADKLLLDASYLGLWAAGALPGWLALLVVGRDLVILGGALTWRLTIGPLEAAPTRVSKATTLAQILLVLAWLLHLAYLPLPQAALTAGGWLVATLTAISGLDYVVSWSLKARRARESGIGNRESEDAKR